MADTGLVADDDGDTTATITVETGGVGGDGVRPNALIAELPTCHDAGSGGGGVGVGVTLTGGGGGADVEVSGVEDGTTVVDDDDDEEGITTVVDDGDGGGGRLTGGGGGEGETDGSRPVSW